MWQNAKTNYRRATSIYDYRRPTPTQMKTTPTDDAAHLHDAPTRRTFGTGKESHHGQMTREGGFPRHVALIGEVYGDDVRFYYYRTTTTSAAAVPVSLRRNGGGGRRPCRFWRGEKAPPAAAPGTVCLSFPLKKIFVCPSPP